MIEQVGEFQTTDVESARQRGAEIGGSGRAGANFLVAKGEAEIAGTISSGQTDSTTRSRTVSSRIAAINALRQCSKPLIVDDFHYLPREFQGNLIRAVKSLSFDGHSVAIIAIPHRRYDAVKVEREMAGRIEGVSVPVW